jgi:putative aldouronate transport system permease protein
MPFYGIQLAFKDYRLKGIAASPWNDFAHFKFMTLEPGFIPAFMNTIVISFMRIVVGFPFPILLALLINELRMMRFKRVLQTVFTFPHFLSWVLLSGIMLNILGSNGMVRKIVGVFSPAMFESWKLLYDGYAFRWLLVLSEMWKSAGWGTIIYLAAIAGIDQALYESADIDGANRLQRIWYLTLPGIAGMISIQLILRIGAIMEGGFDQIFNLYSPPVFAQGDIIDTYIYRISFVRASSVDFGFSTAVGLFKNVINFALLIAANSIVRAMGQKTVL